MLCCLHGKAKNKKKGILEVASPSACAVALGEEGFKKTNFFPECLNFGTRQRVFKKKKFKNLSRVLHSGKKIKKKQRRPPANGVKFSPSASTALGKAFPECTIFDTRERRLYRERISRRLFPECCTRGRLPRVQLGLPRVQLALGEASSSCSDWLISARCQAKKLAFFNHISVSAYALSY